MTRDEAEKVAIEEGFLENVGGVLSNPDWRLSKEGIGFFISALLDENVFLRELMKLDYENHQT